MEIRKNRIVNFIYFDAYGIPVGAASTKVNHNQSVPTAHLKNLIHKHLPYGYKIMHDFAFPKTVNFQGKASSDIYVAVQDTI